MCEPNGISRPPFHREAKDPDAEAKKKCPSGPFVLVILEGSGYADCSYT